jgi:hypothetical protein
MTALDLADGLRLLEATKGQGRFGHEQHLRFGWALLEESSDREEAEHVAAITIRHAAELSGSPNKYHYTVTMFWIRMLDHARDEGVTTVEDAIAKYPMLDDPKLPERHWSNVDDATAKREWVEPDLIPLP